MRIGVIGLGIMGAPMARNLLRAGHAVVVYGRTRARVAELLAAGATAAPSPAALAAAIDTSTIAPEAARRLAAQAAARGVAFLDAPVSGGEQGAIAGTLAIMVGGEAEAVERARPIFAAIGRQTTHMGGPGQGQATKLVNQVIGAVTLAAVAEGIVLATRAGLDPAQVVAAVGGGAAASWMLANLGPRMQRRDFAPGFMVRLQQKDLRLALAAAARLGVPLPTTALVHQLFAAVEAHGGGALGTQALVTALEALAGGPGLPRPHPGG